MTTTQKIEQLARKIEKLRAFSSRIEKFETVCIHSLDHELSPPSVTLYDAAMTVAEFGAAGWVRILKHDGWFNWTREIDGVCVDIYRVEECDPKPVADLDPVPEELAAAKIGGAQ